MLAATMQAETVQKQLIDLDLLRDRIRTQIRATRLSGNAVSRKAGLGLSYVNDLLGGASNRPSVEKIAAIASALDCDLEYLMGRQDDPRPSSVRAPVAPGAGNLVTLPAPRRAGLEGGRVPLYGSPETDAEGYFAMADSPEEMTPLAFEPVIGAYAVVIPDNSLAPRYTIGEKVFVHPRRPLAAGCYAVARLNDGRAIVRRLVSLDPTTAVLEDLVGGEKIVLSRGDINTLHRITASCEA